MTSNQLFTWGAVAFAAFALVQFTRAQAAGQVVANQPGQQQRDAGLAAWNGLLQEQYQELERQTAQEAFRLLERTS